ncbi:MAG: insulinase family protein [Acidobacteriota bacterium]|nr:insulinase family protein [Acidobacteriota bacterium]
MNQQTEEFRKNPPAPLAPRSINLPNPSESVLPNGLKVVVVQDNRLPITTFRLAFRSGSANDPAEMPGLTAMTASQLNEGTATRTSLQIAEEVERLGASLSASASADFTTVSASALSNYAPEILRLMADVVLNPSFPENELALAKQNTLQNLQYQRSQPDFLSNEKVAQVIFGEHPYSRVAPTPVSINEMTCERLAGFHRQIFVPNNAVLLIVGDVDQAAMIKEIETLFGDWQKGEIANPGFPAPPVREERSAFVVDRPGSAQSNIALANIALSRKSPDYSPVLVMNQILGGGASSRLFMNLREEKGYTYGAYSSFDMRKLTGAFEATAEVRTDVTGASLKEFFAELERIRAEEVPAEELQNAKNYLTGVFPIRLETQEGLTGQVLAMQLYDLPSDYLETYRDRISSVTADDIQRVAKQYISTDKLAIVIVGDAVAISDQIKPFSEKIEYFESSGKAKELNKNMDNQTGNTTPEGTWNLSISTPQGELPITVTITNEGGRLGGTINSPLFGDADITSGSINGNNVNAVSSVSFQGQSLEVRINGTIEGNSMRGSVTASVPGVPELSFTGTKIG